MKDEFYIIKDKLEEIIFAPLLSIFFNTIDNETRYIIKIRDLVKSHLIKLKDSNHDEVNFWNEVKCYNSTFLELLNNREDSGYPDIFNKELSELSSRYDDFLKHTDVKRIEEQDNERFKILVGDSLIIKIFKIIKSIVYFITTPYGRTRNLIRKIFKDYEKSLRRWKRKIYFRNLLKLIIRNRLLDNFLDIIREMNMDMTAALLTVRLGEEKINNHFTEGFPDDKIQLLLPGDAKIFEAEREINSALKILQKIRESLQQNSSILLNNIINELDALYAKAGTIEFLSWNYSERIVEKEYNKLIVSYKNSVNGWNNTIYSLFEGWKLDKDIYQNEILNVQELYLLKEESKCKIIEKIIPSLEEMENWLSESKSRIEKQNGAVNFSETLTFEKSALSEILRAVLISKTAEILLDEQIPGSVDKLELNLKSNIERTLTRRAIVKTELYNKEIETSEIEYIDPAEIIRFEIFPSLLKGTHKLKSSIVEQIDEVQKELDDIYGIADLNLRSAINAIDSKRKDLPGGDPKSVVAEGLHRSISKVYEIKSKLLGIYENISRSSSESIASLNKKISELPRLDNISEISSKLIKEKTFEKSLQSKVKRKNILSESIRQMSLHLQKWYKKSSENEPKKNPMSGGEFLNETGNAINKLPYVYQRLFRIEPLVDEKFYEPRTKEMNLLNSAFENWIKGKYAPIVLTGEKGSGVTTTINIFLKSNRNNLSTYELIKGKVENAVTGEEELIKFLGTLLRINPAGKKEIVNSLNTSGKKKIIIIDKIQRMFLRKLGGFNALRLLIEIISETSRNVFWLLTSNIYAWNYMDKVINISDYFGNIIKMNPLSDKQIIDIIQRRHRVSGYNMWFKPSTADLQNKNFLKLNDNKKQIYLREKYFSKLNKFAKSNLSITLLFWMRSTLEVKNDTITIGSLDELDFSFLQSLNDEKIFTLNSMLIHDGLTLENHSVMFNLNIERSKLIFSLLNDDGIITKNNAGFIISPYLYRQAVHLLQSKNILH